MNIHNEEIVKEDLNLSLDEVAAKLQTQSVQQFSGLSANADQHEIVNPNSGKQSLNHLQTEHKSPKDWTITLLIMTKNEIDGMREIMPKIKREWVDQILILDGNSTDGTIEYARENNYPIHVQTVPGIRQAYGEVLNKIEGDILLTFSPDGNSIPELIPDLISKIREGYDMVIVSRYLAGAKSQDDDIITGFGNWLFTFIVNILNGGRYTDAMVIYRAYRTNLIYELELDQDRWHITPEKLFRCRISWEPLLSARAARRKLKVAEIPGDEPPRIGGERKLLVLKWGASYLYQFFRDFLIWR